MNTQQAQAAKIAGLALETLPYKIKYGADIDLRDRVKLAIWAALDMGLILPGKIPWDERDPNGRFLPRPK